jgi:Questin oxidase-like
LIPLLTFVTVGHPLIHLGYAFEMDSKDIGMEALTLTAVQYNFFHKYLDNPAYTKPSVIPSDSPLDLLISMSADSRFSSLPQDPEFGDLEAIFDRHGSLILEYWNAWQLDDPLKQFELSQEAAVAIFAETVRPGTHSFNFLLVHLLTTSHAVRILLPFIPPEHHVTLVREWWLLVIAVFIIKGRPRPDPDNVDKKIGTKSWNYVNNMALTSPYAADAHYVKGILPMQPSFL